MNARKLFFSGRTFTDSNGNEFLSSEIMKYLADYSFKKRVMIQEFIENHSSWKVFTPGGLATCRIVTGRLPDSDEIVVLFGAFRMPVGNSPAYNYSTGGIISRIDIKTGMLGRAFSLYPVYGKYEFQIHPDTGQQIEGATLPYWEELLKFTLDVHSRFKTVFVGWDVCKTEQGFCVIEGNIGWTACGYEIPHHKPFSDTDYPELYEKWMDRFLQNTEA